MWYIHVQRRINWVSRNLKEEKSITSCEFCACITKRGTMLVTMHHMCQCKWAIVEDTGQVHSITSEDPAIISCMNSKSSWGKISYYSSRAWEWVSSSNVHTCHWVSSLSLLYTGLVLHETIEFQRSGEAWTILRRMRPLDGSLCQTANLWSTTVVSTSSMML